MNGNKILIDTNIIIYLLKGDIKILNLLSDKEIFVSYISVLEVLSFDKLKENEIEQINSFFNYVNVLPIDDKLKNNIIQFRINYKLKMPDAIIASTSKSYGLPLFTKDKDFIKNIELELIIYDVN